MTDLNNTKETLAKKVSIVIPVYNVKPCYINDALNSALKQTYKNIEIVIVNDGSTNEATLEYLKTIDNPLVKVISQENSGLAEARNSGIRVAKGEYILPLDADDIIDKTYIEKACSIIENVSEIGIVYCNADFFGTRTGEWQLKDYRFPDFLEENCIFCSALFRKSDWEKVGGYKKEMIYGWEDYEFWLSLIENGAKVYKIPEILFHYRQHEVSMITELINEKAEISWSLIKKFHKSLYEKYEESPNKTEEKFFEKIFFNKKIKDKKDKDTKIDLMSEKISVVIPVYNVEPDYIEDAISSILNQYYQNIEIIVVNDGSTDRATLEYLKTINNPKIRVINQTNKGLGGARNTGIENATGEYIGFLDADDWLSPDFYSVLLHLCEKNNADIACGTLVRTGADYQNPMENFDNIIISNFTEKMSYITNGSVCSKLFNKNLFSNIRFEEHTYYEDNPVLVELLAKSNKVAFTNTVEYYYRENPKSICLNPEKIKKRKTDKFHMLNNILEMIKNKNQKEKDAVLSVFAPILVDKQSYDTETEYCNNVQRLLGKDYKKYLSNDNNSFIEDIFSIKDTTGKTHKVITILGSKFKIKRVAKNRA